jgi:hypothetical protein
MAAVVLPLLRPLPRQVKPFPRETTESYLGRLADANRVDLKALRFHIAGGRRPCAAFFAARLSVVSNLPEHTLHCALPDLGPTDSFRSLSEPRFTQRNYNDGPACRLCVLGVGISASVRCWKQPEDVICLRHRRWTCSWAGEDQPDLSSQPDILQAHKRHLRLVRRFGRSAVAFGYAVADHICRQWHEQRRYDKGFQRRMQIFHCTEWRLPRTDPTIAAAIYPQVIALTRLLASPYWQSQAIPGNPSGQARFAREVRQMVAPGYIWPQPSRSADPLYQWIFERRPLDPSPALFNYSRWHLPPCPGHSQPS